MITEQLELKAKIYSEALLTLREKYAQANTLETLLKSILLNMWYGYVRDVGELQYKEFYLRMMEQGFPEIADKFRVEVRKDYRDECILQEQIFKNEE